LPLCLPRTVRRWFGANSYLPYKTPLTYHEGHTAKQRTGNQMEYRTLGRTGYNISAISFGAWAIGGDAWGNTDDSASLAALNRALDLGVNFIDTADVYGDGHSEQLISQVRKQRSEPFYIATKAGRRLPAQTPEGYNRANLTAWVERSLKNLDTEAIDVLQLHCPPTPVYHMPEVFAILDGLVRDGKLRYYGVSVERVDEALAALDHPNVQSVQIIFNLFRMKPADAFFAKAREHGVGILARVPLASGLLSGRLRPDTTFSPNDHRTYNRHGEAFDQGETFSGVDYTTGLQAVEQLRPLVPDGATLAQFALRWIAMFPEVTASIPGGKTPEQVEENTRAIDLPPLSDAAMARVREVYDALIRPQVQDRW
jgi:aryl-alcohol dehydrogenase-like predicted oxidoreductase